mmetsp:Transcript_27136/g.50225  ORF Transcript_27136/g.50225 Transcript_27136/m.50225 type:complete len:159 (-) Transcript_27136:1704-2180(-)
MLPFVLVQRLERGYINKTLFYLPFLLAYYSIAWTNSWTRFVGVSLDPIITTTKIANWHKKTFYMRLLSCVVEENGTGTEFNWLITIGSIKVIIVKQQQTEGWMPRAVMAMLVKVMTTTSSDDELWSLNDLFKSNNVWLKSRTRTPSTTYRGTRRATTR